jgi:hypothetical protein
MERVSVRLIMQKQLKVRGVEFDAQSRVARLEGEGIDEEVHEDDVALRAVGVGA